MHHVEKPPVLLWYRIYCGAMLILSFLLFAGGIALFFFRADVLGSENDMLGIVYAAALVSSSMLSGLLYLISFILPARPGSWIYHLVLILWGIPSCCCLPFSLGLLIYWIKPETQRYFGRHA